MRQALVDGFGTERVAVFEAWRELVARSRELPEAEKLRVVNDFFNRNTRFDDDDVIWGEADYWATPIQTIGRAAGDCEDFTVAKYFTLLELGVPPERMRLTYVRARIGGPASPVSRAHMVVSYYPTPAAEPLLLDNLVPTIRLASKRPDLVPVFSFNMQEFYVAGSQVAASPVERLSRWRDLLLRMKREGYEP